MIHINNDLTNMLVLLNGTILFLLVRGTFRPFIFFRSFPVAKIQLFRQLSDRFDQSNTVRE